MVSDTKPCTLEHSEEQPPLYLAHLCASLPRTLINRLSQYLSRFHSLSMRSCLPRIFRTRLSQLRVPS